MLIACMTVVNGQTFGSLYQRLIFCFQEIHLVPDQIFAFQLHAQSYDWFFSLSTSKSTGVCIGVKRALGIIPNKIGEIPGHMMLLDLNSLRIMNIYAPNDPKEHLEIFADIKAYISERLCLLGDFNSVTDSLNRLSGNLDRTSTHLSDLLLKHNLEEIEGPHC